MFLGLLDPDPDPDSLVKGMDPRIQIRIHTKIAWIRDTAYNENSIELCHRIRHFTFLKFIALCDC
jgi:hypothetical protein